MIRTLHKMAIAAMAVGLSCCTAVAAIAQSGSADDPAVIVSLKNISGQLDDVKYLGEKAGFADQVAMLPMMARGFLAGVDLKKPAGMALWFEGQEPIGVVMVPVTDIEQLLDQLAGFGINIDEQGEYYYLDTQAQEMVVKTQGGYAFLADKEESLANLPKDPAAVLGAVSKDYTMAAKLYVQRIPAELREMAIEQMEAGFQEAMEEMDEEALADFQRQANEMQIKQLVELVENSDALEIGMGVQPSKDKLVFDMKFTGLPGSKMAKQSEASEGKTSQYTKFLVDTAAVSVNGYGVMLEDDKQMTKALLTNLKYTAMAELDSDEDMSSDELELVKGLLGNVIDLLESTVEGGFMDFGGTVMMDDQGFNMAMGGTLADGGKFDELMAKVSGMAKTQNEVAIEVSDASVAGVEMKKMVITLPEDMDQEAIDMFGETVTVMMGRKGGSAYMAMGNDPAATFEKIMSNSSSSSDYNAQYNLRLMPILKFAARNPEAAEVLGPVLAGFGSDNDRMSLQQKMIPNGLEVNGTADADLIKLLAQIGMSAQGGGPGAEF